MVFSLHQSKRNGSEASRGRPVVSSLRERMNRNRTPSVSSTTKAKKKQPLSPNIHLSSGSKKVVTTSNSKGGQPSPKIPKQRIVSPSPRRFKHQVSSFELDLVIKSDNKRRVVQDLNSSSSSSSLSDDETGTTNTFNMDSTTVTSMLNDEPSLNTMRAGNLTIDDTSSALTSLICIALIATKKPKFSTNDSNTTETNTTATTTTALTTSPDSMTIQSLTRHMRFHLARRLERFEEELSVSDDGSYSSSEDSGGTSEEDDCSSSFASRESSTWTTEDESKEVEGAQPNPLDPDEVHYLAQECLYQGDTIQAIRIYRELLGKQRKNVHAQRADTLSRLAVLCLTMGRKFNKKAMHYSSEALKLHIDNSRPLQASVGKMEVGLCHFAGNRLPKALQFWREAMQLACVAMGYDHPYVAILLNNIGVLHFKAGDYADSLRALEESVELQRTTLRYYCSPINAESAIHQLAATMGNLAVVSDEGLKRCDRAVSYLQESISLYGSVYTFDKDRMEETLSEYMDRLVLARHGAASDQSEGSNSFKSPMASERALTVRSTALFGNSDGIPNRLSRHAIDHNDFLLLGNLVQEISAEERARQTLVAWLGTRIDNKPIPDFAIALPDLVSRPKSSLPVDLDGLHVVNAEQHLREIHLQVIQHLVHDEVDDALDTFRSSLRSHTAKFGDIHHLVGTTLHNIGMVQFFARRYSEAQSSFVEAINVRSAALGPAHQDVCESRTKIGLIHFAKGELSKASETFWDIRDNYVDIFGYGHPQLAKLMNNIGVVAYSQGDLEQAARAFETAHEYIQKQRADDVEEDELLHLTMAHTLSNLAFVCAKSQDPTHALELYEEVLDIYSKHLQDGDPMLGTIHENILHLVSTGGGHDCQIVGPMCFSFP